MFIKKELPIQVAAQCKAWVCGRLQPRILGSNPAGDMDICELRVLRVVRWRSASG